MDASTGLVSLSLRVPGDLRRNLKRLALEEGVPMREVIIRLLQLGIDQNPPRVLES